MLHWYPTRSSMTSPFLVLNSFCIYLCGALRLLGTVRLALARALTICLLEVSFSASRLESCLRNGQCLSHLSDLVGISYRKCCHVLHIARSKTRSSYGVPGDAETYSRGKIAEDILFSVQRTCIHALFESAHKQTAQVSGSSVMSWSGSEICVAHF